jgi:hypothetical protein
MGILEIDENDTLGKTFLEGMLSLGERAKVSLRFSVEFTKKGDEVISMQFNSANIDFIEVPKNANMG